MSRPVGLEFGTSPRAWARSGWLTCLIGAPPAILGALMIVVLPDAWSKFSACGLLSLIMMALLCLSFGVLLIRTGIDSVVRCEDKKVILSDREVHIPRCCGDQSIAYGEIDRVWLDENDGRVLMVRTGHLFQPEEIPTSYFASDEEVNRFIEELRKRVENAKRLTESPPITS